MQQKDECRLLEYQIASFPVNLVFLKIRGKLKVYPSQKTADSSCSGKECSRWKEVLLPDNARWNNTHDLWCQRERCFFSCTEIFPGAWVAGMIYATLFRISGLSPLSLGIEHGCPGPFVRETFYVFIFSSPASLQKPLYCSLVGNSILENHK